jgi:protein gp37
MRTTKIEWTESTWNPTSGCTKVSLGCQHCYAERMAKRLQAMGNEKYQNGFELTLHPDVLPLPYSWKTSRMVFVNSMSDLFHEQMPLDYIQKVFQVMRDNPKHTFQVLTKRAEIVREYSKYLTWSENIWMGVSIETQEYIARIEHLKDTGAHIKFLSLEPLLGEITDMDLSGIAWVIVGGESGPGARPMRKEWVLKIKEACVNQDVSFFFKQWGGVNKKKAGRLLEGKTWDEMPKPRLSKRDARVVMQG